MLLGLGVHVACLRFGPRHDGRRFGLALALGLVDELLGQQQRSLQGLVGEAGLDRGLRIRDDRRHRLRIVRLAPLLCLELADPVAGLAQTLVQLPNVLLQCLGLLGRLVEVLIDLIDVVTLEPESKLDRAQRVERG